MKHPSEAKLALYAGGDLGRIARWRTDRHLTRCDRCREEVAAFARVREIVPELGEIPEVSWSRLAAEMKANIRLGLAAGECVRTGEAPKRRTLFSGARAAVALASIAAVLVTAVVLEHPSPQALTRAERSEGVVVQTTTNGIQVREGGQALRLMHSGAQNVTYSVGAQGSMRARYVDPETGYVTINNVYVE
jgi:anti-sigma factor RsiW